VTWTAGAVAAVFKAALRGRSRRRRGALAVAPAGGSAPAGPAPVGWREGHSFGAAEVQAVTRAAADLTRGPLAAGIRQSREMRL
jgi:hypothetical protein